MDIQRYVIGWLERARKREVEEKKLAESAKECAERCAAVLGKLGAKRVYLLGSLRDGYFCKGSDIDLAVEGLEAGLYFKALVEIHKISDSFSIDLVPLEDYRYKETIVEEGELIYETA